MDEAFHEAGHEPTPTLAEAHRLRVDIHDALVAAEEALSGPASGRAEAWAREVVVALGRLRETIEDHIEVTERPRGLYDEILENAPRLAGAVERLRQEHPALRDATSEAIARLRTTPIGTTWSLEEARDDIQRLFGSIVRHRQHGADLVWEAYNLDIGGIE